MRRLQLQLDEDIHEALLLRAYQERKSLSAVAREVLGAGLGLAKNAARERQSFKFIASGRSGRKDVSVRHDEALSEDFK